MLFFLRQFILIIHIMLGFIWVGGILFVGWGVYPAVKRLTIAEQRLFLYTLMKRTHIIFIIVGLGVITTGTMLGTVLDPIKSWQDLVSTSFGTLLLTSFILGILTLSWGSVIAYKTTMKMLLNNSIWENAIKDEKKPLQRKMRQVTFIASIEVCGLISLIVLMVFL